MARDLWCVKFAGKVIGCYGVGMALNIPVETTAEDRGDMIAWLFTTVMDLWFNLYQNTIDSLEVSEKPEIVEMQAEWAVDRCLSGLPPAVHKQLASHRDEMIRDITNRRLESIENAKAREADETDPA